MKIAYIIKEGFSGFSRAKLAAAASIITISISLILLGLFIIVSINTSRLVDLVREKVEMEAFLEEPAPRVAIYEIQNLLLKTEGVDSITFISKEDASKIFKEDFGEDVLSILEFNPFPPSFKIYLNNKYKTAEAAQIIFDKIKSVKGIDEVIYRKDIIEFLDKRTKSLNTLGLIMGAIIGISAVFLVSNTTRLAIYSKRKLIKTMKLVGATRWFIRMPFLLEGILQGISGGFISSVILYIIIQTASKLLSAELLDFLRIDIYIYGIIVILGTILGFLGSLFSVRKYISESIAV